PWSASVSRNGDVAVTTLTGGVVAIAGTPGRCPDATNTSSGADDVRDFPDGCVQWFTPTIAMSQRTIAWTPGTIDPLSCDYDAQIWVPAKDADIDVLLLDGESGAIEESLTIPGLQGDAYGFVSSAVDSNGNLWGYELPTTLVRIDRTSLEVETWPSPAIGFGVAVDADDRAWVCGHVAARFDYGDGTWESQMVAQGGGGGCAQGIGDALWLATDPLVAIDVDTFEVLAELDEPAGVFGIALDFGGNAWGLA